VGDVGNHDDQLVPLLGRQFVVVDFQVTPGGHAVLRQVLGDERVQRVPGEQAFVEEQTEPLAEQLEVFENGGLVLELGEVLLGHDLLQRARVDPGGQERGDDRAGRRPGDSVELV
jgi:hypothetical protein